jgi:hypothetical protein
MDKKASFTDPENNNNNNNNNNHKNIQEEEEIRILLWSSLQLTEAAPRQPTKAALRLCVYSRRS